MKPINKYSKYIRENLKVPKVTKAENIVFEIIRDFTDRRGFKYLWDDIDDDVKNEIIEKWIKIAKNIEP